MNITQNEKAARFRALHDSVDTFIIPNPWDVPSARLLAGLGFQALATSSGAAAAFSSVESSGIRCEPFSSDHAAAALHASLTHSRSFSSSGSSGSEAGALPVIRPNKSASSNRVRMPS